MRLVLFFVAVSQFAVAEHRGTVKCNGLPVPGATVTAIQAGNRISTITGLDGEYTLPEVSSGTWTIEVEMTGFAKTGKEVSLVSEPLDWDLKILPFEQLRVESQAAKLTKSPAPAAPPTQQPRPAQASEFANLDAAELTRRAADVFLLNGATNNAASSPFSQSAAFGPNRRNGSPLYTGNIGLIVDNAALNARPYSLTGQDTPRPQYNRLQGVLALGGPLRIPRLLRNGPNVTLNYQWTRNSDVSTRSALMPTRAERNGDFSNGPAIFDPQSGAPFPDNMIPASRISPQAKSLLDLYPLPNFADERYNYQIPIIGATHQDSLQLRGNQRLSRKNQLSGNLSYQSTRIDNPNIFNFLDVTDSSGVNTGLSWLHHFQPRLYAVIGMQFSRLASLTTPYFANRTNISGEAGITGNDQEAVNWGPPALSFSSGLAALTDAQYSRTANQTTGVSIDAGWGRGRHTFLFGGALRRQQFNVLSQEDPRGTFTFTGAAAGSDVAGFLLGVPDASSIAFGNADKYLRAVSTDAYINDDWRLQPGLTLNFGLRWEYGSPITELYGRLVNLDIASGFTAVTPLVAASTPSPLIRPDRNNLAPRFGFAWRPFAASSMVVRGGYGIYYDTSVYQPIAMQMAQQSPLSKSLRVQNSPENPLSLANGFYAPPSTLRNTFAIDPDFRIGYSQNWQLSIQKELPASLVLIATYLGIKGTRAQQQFLPNTFPAGALNQCSACPSGFTYLASNGNSIRHAGQLELRRRLSRGFTATLQYTYAKSIDNAAVGGRNQGGVLTAQNWLDLTAERALSNFDQRHLANLLVQYTTVNMRKFLKEWTFSAQITAGTGLPLTPIFPSVVDGTGVTGTVRPDYFGGDVLKANSYAAPVPGRWGNAGRNSITGPSQFSFNASIARTFRMGDRFNWDFRVDSTNALNHPVFPSWITTVTSAQFGLPNTTNPMRSLQTTIRLRF